MGTRAVFALLVLCVLSAKAWAYKLNPCLRELTYSHGHLGQEPINKNNPCHWAPEKYRQAVHEHMTVMAIEEHQGHPGWHRGEGARRFRYMTAPTWPVDAERRRRTSAIVYGTWWNDDPLMHLWGGGADFRRGMKDVLALLDPRKTSYPGGLLNCRVESGKHLAWHSHFGGLQHLHFMTTLPRNESTAAQRIEATREQALLWMEFAYGVAVGRQKPGDPLGPDQEQALGLPPIADNHCIRRQANVKIRTLFTRQGMPLSVRNAITPDVALGTMLHLLQDSFSPAHTCRIPVQQGTETLALLVDVFNYNEQDADAHSARDVYPPWLLAFAKTGKRQYANDPVAVGAWLIGAVQAGLPWDEVKAHLANTAFAQAHSPPADARCIGP